MLLIQRISQRSKLLKHFLLFCQKEKRNFESFTQCFPFILQFLSINSITIFIFIKIYFVKKIYECEIMFLQNENRYLQLKSLIDFRRYSMNYWVLGKMDSVHIEVRPIRNRPNEKALDMFYKK